MKVVHKILQLLELFADGKEYSFTSVIEMTGLSRSNASHLLSALVEEGVLSRSGRGIYRRSEGMFRLSGRDLFAEFRRITRNGALLLRDQLDELAVVAIRRGIFRLTVEKVQPTRLLQVAEKTAAGYPVDWYGTGNGRVLLACAPRTILIEIVKHCGLPAPQIWKEAGSLPKLERELASIRKNNFCSMTLNNEVRITAVPVQDAAGEKSIALSTAFPVFRNPSADEKILDRLRYTAECMEKELQNSGIRISDLEQPL